MYIRQTRTRNSITGEGYFTYRLVRGERVGGKVRQLTVLNLGRDFPIKPEHWVLLCTRIGQLLAPQEALLALPCPAHVERAAQRYAARLVVRAPDAEGAAAAGVSQAGAQEPVAAQFEQIDVDSLQQTQARSVGVEHVALHALEQLGVVDKLQELGVNGVMRACIVGNIVGRMAAPASELATWDWLQSDSALGELMDVDYGALSHMRLYRASDLLMRHRSALEEHVFSSVHTLFSLQETVTLYDLTNTYFEGQAEGNPKARRGRSKEKRSDCPLITLGLVLDGSGFVRRSKTFAGNVTEASTLQTMLQDLSAPVGAMIIMDAGIATQANLAWLRAQGYHYLVVRRGGERAFDPSRAVSIESAAGASIGLHKELSADGTEVHLHCHSEGREAKETAITARFAQAFEAGLGKIAQGLQKPRCEKRHAKLLERIGRLKQKSRGTSQHYTVNLQADATGMIATALTWESKPVSGTMATHPGVYCLRSNQLQWDEERLWRTYTMLTDLESVFRSLKGELGLRPVFHSKEDRSDGHLFITVLAYQCVQVLRHTLKGAGINESWSTLRKTLLRQQRVTASQRRKDGRSIHVRKSTVAEPNLMEIYKALGLNPAPGGTKKLIV